MKGGLSHAPGSTGQPGHQTSGHVTLKAPLQGHHSGPPLGPKTTASECLMCTPGFHLGTSPRPASLGCPLLTRAVPIADTADLSHGPCAASSGHLCTRHHSTGPETWKPRVRASPRLQGALSQSPERSPRPPQAPWPRALLSRPWRISGAVLSHCVCGHLSCSMGTGMVTPPLRGRAWVSRRLWPASFCAGDTVVVPGQQCRAGTVQTLRTHSPQKAGPICGHQGHRGLEEGTWEATPTQHR